MFVELYLHIYADLVVRNPLWYDQAKPKILLLFMVYGISLCNLDMQSLF